MKVSIIIPVYNCEKFLDKCIDSILQQSYQNWELILIDDGSDDNSLKVCKSYQEADSRIKVFSQVNSGPSIARNKGLEIATGTHCLFIDADDWLEYDALSVLNTQVLKSNPQLIFFGYSHDFIENGMIKNSNTNILMENEYKSSIKFSEDFLYYAQNGAINPVWNKLYNKEFIEDIKALFPQDVRYTEDLVFNLKVYQNANHIKVIDKLLYHYVSHSQESLSTKFNENRINDLKSVYNYIFDIINSWCPQHLNYFKNCLIHEISVFINSMFNMNTKIGYKSKRMIIKKLTTDSWIQSSIKDSKELNLRNKIIKTLIILKMNDVLFLTGKIARLVKYG